MTLAFSLIGTEQLRATADRPAMLDHTGFVVSDLAKARRFYDAIAKALGLGRHVGRRARELV